MTQSRIRGILACFNRGINSPINLSAFTAHIRLNVNGLQYVVFHPSRVSPLPGRMGVSILVFLELALGQLIYRRFESQKQVSILVFLELALGHFSSIHTTHNTKQFQSLFSWNLPSDIMTDPPIIGDEEFQSLFSWNLPSDLQSQE